MNNKTTQHPQQVNRMVSFNAIKHHAFELFYSDLPTDELFERLTPLFLSHPPAQDRIVNRHEKSDHRLKTLIICGGAENIVFELAMLKLMAVGIEGW